MECYSHLKNRMETVIQTTARATITIMGSKTLSTGKLSVAAFKSFMPCVKGITSATF